MSAPEKLDSSMPIPRADEAERSALGALLVDRDAIATVAETLDDGDFFDPALALVYRAIQSLYRRRIPPDVITVSAEAERLGGARIGADTALLAGLLADAYTSVHLPYYADLIRRAASLRRLLTTGGEIARLASAPGADPDAIAASAAAKLQPVDRAGRTGDLQPLAEVLGAVIDRIDAQVAPGAQPRGCPSGYADLDRLTGGWQPSDLVVIAARPAVGKCLPGWVLVDDPRTGERVPMERFVRERRSSVLATDDHGRIVPAAVTDWIDNGYRECYRVTTRNGRTVDATGNHPFFTARGWRPLQELTVGASIAVPACLPAFGESRSWSIDRVRLLAYFIADGGLTDSSPEFTKSDPAIVASFAEAIANEFPEVRLYRYGITYCARRSQAEWHKNHPGKGGTMPANPVRAWLEEVGLWGKLSREKQFPEVIWTWDRPYLIEFIRALMSCDGSIYAVNNSVRIEFTVASKQLARDVQHALLRLGIIASFKASGPNAWRVFVSDPSSIDRYQRTIGWIGEKATRYPEYSANGLQHTSNIGHPPRETWDIVRGRAREQGMSLVEMARRSGETEAHGHASGWNPHTNRSIPARRLRGYAETLNSPELARIASPNLYWDEIVAIEPIGAHRVYDITVPEHANFIAQDICVHNSAAALAFARHAARAGRAVAFFSLEMGVEQLALRLVAAESGVDLTRLRDATLLPHEWYRTVHATASLARLPIYLTDAAPLTVEQIRARVERLRAREPKLGLVVVDYVGLLTARGENRVAEVSAITRGLKVLARSSRLPILALSQLNRAVEHRPGGLPQLSDLRESGCLVGDTRVFLPATGGYIPIRDLVGRHEGAQVLAIDPATWRLEPRTLTNAFATGVRPVSLLRLQSGRSIRATANHRFLTLAGWRRLDELGTDDRLAVPRHLPTGVGAHLSHDRLALLAHFIGNGCTIPRHAIQYTTGDPAMADLVVTLAGAAFPDQLRSYSKHERNWYQVYFPWVGRPTHGKRSPLVLWLETMGLYGKRAWEKTIPACVFSEDADGIAVFLRHLWATDGSISVGKSGLPSVSYTSTSERLAEGVQSLLLRLGICAVRRRVPQRNSPRDIHMIAIQGGENMARFVRLIGVIGAKARHVEPILAYAAHHPSNPNNDTIPSEAWHARILPAMQRAGMTTRDLARAMDAPYNGTAIYNNGIGRARLARIAVALNDPSLEQLATSDVYWDRVAAITPDGEEETYDLTVDGPSNFVAGDIVAHNSLEQDSDIVIFLHRDEVKDPDSERRGLLELHIAKHRNGPLGTVALRANLAIGRLLGTALAAPNTQPVSDDAF